MEDSEKKIRIGILREIKEPPDRRVPLLPEQCLALQEQHPEIVVEVQSSKVRCIPDENYVKAGISVFEDVSSSDILFGIKEIPPRYLLENKTYLFFSHTTKMQPHNRAMLQMAAEKGITLIDYECMTDFSGSRLVAFGRYAGIVGAYNGIRAFGIRYELFHLKPAWTTSGLGELYEEYKKVKLPNIKIVVTSTGRVSKGAQEVLNELGIIRVSPREFKSREFDIPVYTVLESTDYYIPIDPAEPSAKENFYKHPERFKSVFWDYARVADMLIACAFWRSDYPKLFEKETMRLPDFRIRVIADVSCDVDGSIPSTIRTTSIEHPFYDYNPVSGQEEPPFSSEDHITVMAIDNLPCELPVEASREFGKQLIEHVFPALVEGDSQGILQKATILKKGKLTEPFKYLSNYLN